MKRVFLLLIVALLSCNFLCAYYVNYVKDEFGDYSDDFYMYADESYGEFKLNTGKKAQAKIRFVINNFNSDVLIKIYDKKEYKYNDLLGERQYLFVDKDCYLVSKDSTIIVKIKYENGTVKEYEGILCTDDINGSGANNVIQVKDLKKEDIIDQKTFKMAISNSYVSYTFNRVVSTGEETLLAFKMIGDWKITNSTEPNITTGELHFGFKGNMKLIIEDHAMEYPSMSMLTETYADVGAVFYINSYDVRFTANEPHDGQRSYSSRYYKVSFSSDGNKAVLTNTKLNTEFTLERL